MAAKCAHKALGEEIVTKNARNQKVLTKEFLEEVHREAAPSNGISHCGEYPINLPQ